jgi:hypothetical protein
MFSLSNTSLVIDLDRFEDWVSGNPDIKTYNDSFDVYHSFLRSNTSNYGHRLPHQSHIFKSKTEDKQRPTKSSFDRHYQFSRQQKMPTPRDETTSNDSSRSIFNHGTSEQPYFPSPELENESKHKNSRFGQTTSPSIGPSCDQRKVGTSSYGYQYPKQVYFTEDFVSFHDQPEFRSANFNPEFTEQLGYKHVDPTCDPNFDPDLGIKYDSNFDPTYGNVPYDMMYDYDQLIEELTTPYDPNEVEIFKNFEKLFIEKAEDSTRTFEDDEDLFSNHSKTQTYEELMAEAHQKVKDAGFNFENLFEDEPAYFFNYEEPMVEAHQKAEHTGFNFENLFENQPVHSFNYEELMAEAHQKAKDAGFNFDNLSENESTYPSGGSDYDDLFAEAYQEVKNSGLNLDDLFDKNPRERSNFSYDQTPSWQNTDWGRSFKATKPKDPDQSRSAQKTGDSHRVATEEDAKRRGLPPGLYLKRWDPSEVPMTLLGSVFDINSLGKWIFDWTYHRHGAKSEVTDQACELWNLLVKTAGKIKRAKKSLKHIDIEESRDMVVDFYESGKRLLVRLQNLLHDCEAPMLAMKQKNGKLGKCAGVVFVDSFFGEGVFLHRVDGLMYGMKTWTKRFDANCEEILSAINTE